MLEVSKHVQYTGTYRNLITQHISHQISIPTKIHETEK